MQHGLSVVADLTAGDSEMQRAVQEVIKAFGGLDIIVNRHVPPPTMHAVSLSTSGVHALSVTRNTAVKVLICKQEATCEASC